ncbi:MAG: VWA domain-containing protein [Gemmataceae bacterium]|nr:VWA domain-containing protein [Gemmataceae bacterium]MDW8265646.1 VWA domain-containing protein [Gemmataceae bacterium]
MPPPFPFSALVGLDTLKRALVLSVIQPGLGGVLIRGTKGVAKSTAVRALASLLPPIETVAGCPFQRRPGEEIPHWPLPPDSPTERRPTPLVELPLGATEDRILGCLHLERALRGERAFEPGLLAAANRGILYIDEVNLLPDHLVDVLLDAAASGVHRLEREGLSLTHPAQFVLIGTMNPEEGELRPQLLDRFGLVVDVADLTDPAERAEAVRRRLAYDADPAGFHAAWKAADAEESERIVRARRRVSEVCLPDEVIQEVSRRCVAAGVEGLRADLTICRAAIAWAAYQGRTLVAPADVEAVAELALAHRRRSPPGRPPGGTTPDAPGSVGDGRSALAATSPPRLGISAVRPNPSSLQVFPSDGTFPATHRPPKGLFRTAGTPGRWPGVAPGRLGCGAARPAQLGSRRGSIAWADTLRAAGRRQPARSDRLSIGAEDLRIRPALGPAGCLVLFVVDASGSMAAWQRMRRTKSAILSLLAEGYRRRDRVSILAFRGDRVEQVLPPRRGLGLASQALEALPVGGTTPLADGLAAAANLLRRQRRCQPRQPSWVVVLTDGRANISRHADPWADALTEAARLARYATALLVIDTETGWPRWGRAAQLAVALGADYAPLDAVLRLPCRQAVG